VFIKKYSLRILNISYNNIGDDGITAIAEALGNSQITNLYVSECGISITGARSLAAGLLVNNSVRILDVRDNPITMEGAHLILQSAMDNPVCHVARIDDKYKNDEIMKMMIILNRRRDKGY